MTGRGPQGLLGAGNVLFLDLVHQWGVRMVLGGNLLNIICALFCMHRLHIQNKASRHSHPSEVASSRCVSYVATARVC